MGRRHRRKIEMEEALSLGDALSIRIIVFLLLVIFLVPLISIGKARLVKAKKDDLWPKVAAWIQVHKQEIPKSYRTALELNEASDFVVTKSGAMTWIESFNPIDSTLLVIRHNPASGKVRMMRIERFGTVPMLNENQLSWSPLEGEWFASGTSELMNADSMNQNFIRDYKQTILRGRGF